MKGLLVETVQGQIPIHDGMMDNFGGTGAHLTLTVTPCFLVCLLHGGTVPDGPVLVGGCRPPRLVSVDVVRVVSRAFVSHVDVD